jgi:peptidoglycan hydrolase-like protein with peptidoglycan-binding domain
MRREVVVMRMLLSRILPAALAVGTTVAARGEDVAASWARVGSDVGAASGVIRVAAKAAPTKSPPAKTAPAAALPAQAFYATMTGSERNAILSDLIWTGDYNGVVGAEFGERVIEALKAFQKRNGGKDTGILNPEERTRLAQSARSRQDQAGWRIVDDAATGARLGIPAKITPQAAAGKSGSHWQSAHGEVQIDTFRVAAPDTTLASMFEQQRKEPDRKVDYNVLRGDFFVISGLQGLKKFYLRAQGKDNDVRGITILYDQAMEGTIDRIAVAMSSAFSAFPSGVTERRRVEYGTGLVVSASGDILADGELMTGCEFIVVPGFGHAEPVATDKTLALIRVNGVPNLAPVALAASDASGSAPPAGDVTLIGIADPQAQNGGAAVSTARGRVVAGGSEAAIEPTPGAGFAGAAVLDGDGNLSGIVALRAGVALPGGAAGNGGSSAASSGNNGANGGKAIMVPAGAVAKFLDGQNVRPVSGHAGLDGVKAATARVICVRK